MPICLITVSIRNASDRCSIEFSRASIGQPQLQHSSIAQVLCVHLYKFFGPAIWRRGKLLGHWKHMTTIILTYCVEQISFSLIHPNNIGYSLLCERMWHLRGEPMHSQVRHWYQRSWLGLIVVTNWQSSLEFARLSVYTHQRRKREEIRLTDRMVVCLVSALTQCSVATNSYYSFSFVDSFHESECIRLALANRYVWQKFSNSKNHLFNRPMCTWLVESEFI